MKRDPRLSGLSSDHHQALVLARRLEASPAPAPQALGERFDRELAPHFRIEEDVLLPALRDAGHAELADRTLADHDALRALVAEARRGAPEAALAFAARLREHVRFEERELFPACEAALDAAILAEVARRAPPPSASAPRADEGVASMEPPRPAMQAPRPASSGAPISLGRRAPREGAEEATKSELVELLLACHVRIRRFLALARTIADRRDVSDAEIVEAAAGCARYFREALPLHVEDEQVSLLPRLAGREPALDRALAAMEAEHAEHAPALAALLDALAAVEASPRDDGARQRLGLAAEVLAAGMAQHLAGEEAVILPAIPRLLSEAERAAVVRELRARRA